MRRTQEEMAGVTLELVYIAGNLRDAEAAERQLTEHGIEYTLTLEPFTTTSLLGGEHTGLFVYVPVARYAESRRLLEAAGLTDTIGPEVSGDFRTPHASRLTE
jgi:hypothetical protein